MQFITCDKHLYFNVILAHLAIGVVKISMLEFYKRIFDVRNFHRAANIVMVFVILWIPDSFSVRITSIYQVVFLISADTSFLRMANL